MEHKRVEWTRKEQNAKRGDMMRFEQTRKDQNANGQDWSREERN